MGALDITHYIPGLQKYTVSNLIAMMCLFFRGGGGGGGHDQSL